MAPRKQVTDGVRLPPKVADQLATRILAQLVETGVLPGRELPDWERYKEFREEVRRTFEVPGTTITPLMARVLYGISALARPRRVLVVGSYAGNTIVWLGGPGFLSRSLYAGERCVGTDTDARATELAVANFRRIGCDSRTEFFCEDGHDICTILGEHWDLALLDADDPLQRKRVYLSLLDAIYSWVAEGGIVLAHDISVPIFREDMAAYLERVRDPTRFRLSVPLEIDPCGLEVSVK